jgi:hypothetical protein
MMMIIDHAHMPYLCLRAGRRTLVYCAAEGEITREQELARSYLWFRQPWASDPRFEQTRARLRAESAMPTRTPRYRARARDLETGAEESLSPGLADSATVCSPYLIAGELQYIVSDLGRWRNVAGDTPMIKPPWVSTVYGFRSGLWQAWATSSRQVISWHAGDAPRVFAFDLPADAQIYRLAPIDGEDGQWLLTYTSASIGHTLHWDGAALREILIDGGPVYKCSILGETIAWSGGQTGARTIGWRDGYEHGPALAFTTADLPDRAPTLLEMTGNFLGATARFLAGGMKIAPEAVFNERLAICRDACPGKLWREDGVFGLGYCGKCGCTTLKLESAVEKCPLGAWQEI